MVGSTKCVVFPDYLKKAPQDESVKLTVMLCISLCLEFSALK